MGGTASAIFDVEEKRALQKFASARVVGKDDADWELLTPALGLRRWLPADPASAQVRVSEFSPLLKMNNPKTHNFQMLLRKSIQILNSLPNDLVSVPVMSTGTKSSSWDPQATDASETPAVQDTPSYVIAAVQSATNALFLVRKFSQYFIETSDS